MVNVVITGKNSYIGNHIKDWLMKDGNFHVKCVSVYDEEVDSLDFTSIDAIMHVAALVHRKDIKEWNLYEKINIDLTEKLARKAKQAGVKHFVFMSSMAVYGADKSLLNHIEIDKNAPLLPSSFYGKSKLEAEQKILDMEDESFFVSIVRPPNVYGKDCKGGYVRGYKTIVRVLPVIPCAFPNITQSMLYIDNLSELCRLILINQVRGIFTPHDVTSVSSVELMKGIAAGIGKKRYWSRVLGKIVELFPKNKLVLKGYGGIAYSDEVTNCFDNQYVVVPFEEAIRRTVD